MRPDSIRRIAVLRLDRLGDALVGLPALKGIRRRFPGSHLTLFIGPWGKEFYKTCPYVDQTVIFVAPWMDGKYRHRNWRSVCSMVSLAYRLWRGHFDLTIGFRGDPYEILAAFLCRAPHRVDMQHWFFQHLIPEAYPNGFERFLTQSAPRLIGEHVLVQNQAILRLLPGDFAAVDSVLDDLKWFRDDPSWVDRLGEDNNSLPLAVIHAGASKRDRWVPIHLAGEIANWLVRDRHFRVIFTGVQEESSYHREILRLTDPSVISLAGKLSIPQLMGLLRGARLVVSTDTGVGHLSMSLGTPTVMLYGSFGGFVWFGPPYAPHQGIWKGGMEVIQLSDVIQSVERCLA